MNKTIGRIGTAITFAFVLASPALAQQYPPTTPTTGPGGVEVQGYGTIRPGQSFIKRDCGFAAGGTTAVSFNGRGAGSATAGSDGCVVLEVEAADAQTVTIDGRAFSARCGGQVIEVAGTAAGGGARAVRNTFVLSCDTSRSLTTTGASIARWTTVAVALIAVGLVFVVADRRRARARSQEG